MKYTTEQLKKIDNKKIERENKYFEIISKLYSISEISKITKICEKSVRNKLSVLKLSKEKTLNRNAYYSYEALIAIKNSYKNSDIERRFIGHEKHFESLILKRDFPIKVEVVGDYYVVPSSINYD